MTRNHDCAGGRSVNVTAIRIRSATITMVLFALGLAFPEFEALLSQEPPVAEEELAPPETPEFDPPEIDVPGGGAESLDDLKDLTERMDSVTEDLSRYRTGEDVQRKQAEIVSRLESLIAKLEKQNGG